MKLIQGGVYQLIDCYGQMMNTGKFIGVGEFQSSEIYRDRVFVFEIITRNEHQYQFSGAKFECSVDYLKYESNIYLKNHYYGMSIEKLFPCNRSRTETKFTLLND